MYVYSYIRIYTVRIKIIALVTNCQLTVRETHLIHTFPHINENQHQSA